MQEHSEEKHHGAIAVLTTYSCWRGADTQIGAGCQQWEVANLHHIYFIIDFFSAWDILGCWWPSAFDALWMHIWQHNGHKTPSKCKWAMRMHVTCLATPRQCTSVLKHIAKHHSNTCNFLDVLMRWWLIDFEGLSCPLGDVMGWTHPQNVNTYVCYMHCHTNVHPLPTPIGQVYAPNWWFALGWLPSLPSGSTGLAHQGNANLYWDT